MFRNMLSLILTAFPLTAAAGQQQQAQTSVTDQVLDAVFEAVEPTLPGGSRGLSSDAPGYVLPEEAARSFSERHRTSRLRFEDATRCGADQQGRQVCDLAVDALIVIDAPVFSENRARVRVQVLTQDTPWELFTHYMTFEVTSEGGRWVATLVSEEIT